MTTDTNKDVKIKTKAVNDVVNELKQKLNSEQPNITKYTKNTPKTYTMTPTTVENDNNISETITKTNETDTAADKITNTSNKEKSITEEIKTPNIVLKKNTTNLKPDLNNIALENLQVLIDRYLKINKGVLVNKEQREKASTLMKNIVTSVITTPTTEMVNKFFNFVKNNRTKALAPELVFQGCKNIQKDMIHKMQILYGYVYYVTSTTYTRKPNLTIVQKTLGSELTNKLVIRSQKK